MREGRREVGKEGRKGGREEGKEEIGEEREVGGLQEGWEGCRQGARRKGGEEERGKAGYLNGVCDTTGVVQDSKLWLLEFHLGGVVVRVGLVLPLKLLKE